MKVLITGGAGFLGRRLAAKLLQLGTLKNAELREEKIQQITLFDMVPALGFNDPRIRVVTGDVSDAEALEGVIDEDTTSIFHLAAVVSSQAEDDFDLGLSINLDASRRLFEACRKVGHTPKVIFASSLANAMLMSRKVFSTTLVISAVRMLVTTMSPLQKEAYIAFIFSPIAGSSAPIVRELCSSS